ncbi:lipoprotein [Pseudomonas synxantha]|uniref:lipoprotein n=1 Tax=Pseudomonas synxantha TaxID=47883 RepID=UPI00345D208E
MKKLIVTFLIATALTGCQSEIDHAQTVIRNGLFYKFGDTDPYSGLVVNIPVGLPGMTALCNSQIEKGRNNGHSECFFNGQKVYEVQYQVGSKHGTERVFDAKTGNPVAVMNWNKGRQDGVTEQYLEGHLVARRKYANGKQDGEETRWSDDGKIILTKLTWRAGEKQEGFWEDSEGQYRYLNGQLHGAQRKYDYIAGKLKRYTAAEENYDQGKLEGVQKRFVNILHTDIVQQESEITYVKGVAITGWLKKFDPVNGTVIQEIQLTQSPDSNDEDFFSGYPGNLVPDGVVKQPVSEGEEVWANGIKLKFSYNYGEPSFQVLENTTSHESYKEVSQAEYLAYGAPSSAGSKTLPLTHKENCLEDSIAAYRNEMGKDALITSEQLGEWRDDCIQGKTH